MGRPRKYRDQDILHLWERTRNIREIARQLGAPYKSILRYTERLGIRPGKGGTPRPPSLKFDIELVRRMYNSGYSTVQIGEHLGVSSEVVRRRMERHGIPRRDKNLCRARGENNSQWKGGKSKMNKYRRESYEVVAICLGRPLPPGWVIHHLDENHKNNDPSNICLFESQAVHCRFHQQLLALQLEGNSGEAIQMALENGARWLPPPPCEIQFGPCKDRIGLLKRPAQYEPAHEE
jgi:hypothetical protein